LQHQSEEGSLEEWTLVRFLSGNLAQKPPCPAGSERCQGQGENLKISSEVARVEVTIRGEHEQVDSGAYSYEHEAREDPRPRDLFRFLVHNQTVGRQNSTNLLERAYVFQRWTNVDCFFIEN
jgi:hypothetical protein